MSVVRVNLIPVARQDAMQKQSHVRWWVIVNGLATIALVISVGLSRAVAAHEDAAVTAKVESLSIKVEQADSALELLRSEVEKAREEAKPNPSVGHKPNWSILLSVLANKLGEVVVLRSCELQPLFQSKSGELAPVALRTGNNMRANEAQPSSYMLRLEGLGRSLASVSEFTLQLEGLKFFDRVKLVKTTREPFLRGEAVAFELECKINDMTGELQ